MKATLHASSHGPDQSCGLCVRECSKRDETDEKRGRGVCVCVWGGRADAVDALTWLRLSPSATQKPGENVARLLATEREEVFGVTHASEPVGP